MADSSLVCTVCGAPCRARFVVPTAEMAPDLDGRPGEPARSTLRRWLARCRTCGAVAPDLAALPETAGPIVRSAAYQGETNDFLRWATLCDVLADPAGAAEALLQAAWQEEDAGRDGSAFRRQAAARWLGDDLRRIDILRRAGALDDAMARLQALPDGDEDVRRITAFEADRIRAGDTGRHSIASALRPPARTPHVTHGRIPTRSGGLLARLFGR